MAACDSPNESVQVLVTPSDYRVGPVRSALATPAVDEIVRQHPGDVLIVACRATSAAKTVQLHTELAARYAGKIQMTFTDEGCPNA